MAAGRNLYLLPNAPLEELSRRVPNAQIEFDPGMTPAEAAMVARRCDVAIVFAIRAMGATSSTSQRTHS